MVLSIMMLLLAAQLLLTAPNMRSRLLWILVALAVILWTLVAPAA